MIVLTLEPGEDEKLRRGRARPAAQVRDADRPGPVRAHVLLRARLPRGRRRAAERARAPRRRCCAALRVRAMLGGLLDDPALLAAAAADVGLDPDELDALERDARRSRTRCGPTSSAARSPSPPPARSTTSSAGRAQRAPLHRAELRARRPSGRTFSIPGFNPVEAYETAIANLGLDLPRRPSPSRSSELLAWAERAAGDRRGRSRSCRPTRPRPAPRWPRAATPIPAGADFYWTLARR